MEEENQGSTLVSIGYSSIGHIRTYVTDLSSLLLYTPHFYKLLFHLNFFIGLFLYDISGGLVANTAEKTVFNGWGQMVFLMMGDLGK